MVKKRLIVSLLWRNGNLVQSIKFKHTNVVGSVFTAMEFFNAWESDEILLLNVSRDDDNFEIFLHTLKGLSKLCFVPLSVGGWINNIEKVDMIIEGGADKIVVNTHAFVNPGWITTIAEKYGSQCVIVSIDAKLSKDGIYEVYIDRGRCPTGVKVDDWAREAERRGAGEIYITSIDHDGVKGGYDLKMVDNVVKAVNIPVIAFGGVGNWDHMVDGLNAGGAHAVAAGNIFHYFEQSVRQAKRHLIKAGLDVRIPDNYTM